MTTLRIGCAPLAKTGDQRRAERRALLERVGQTVDWLAAKTFYGLFSVLACWLLAGNAVSW